MVMKVSAEKLSVADFALFSQLFLFLTLPNSIAAGGVQSGVVRRIAAAPDAASERRSLTAGRACCIEIFEDAFVFCSFLALAMQKYLDDLSYEAGVAPEWKELLRDLDRLQQVRLQYRGADWLVRTGAAQTITTLFRQARVALPPRAANRPANGLRPLENPPKTSRPPQA